VQRMGNWKSRVMVQRYAHLADLVGIRNAKKPVQKKKKAGKTAGTVSRTTAITQAWWAHLDSNQGSADYEGKTSWRHFKVILEGTRIGGSTTRRG